jgi:hypothetical protein
MYAQPDPVKIIAAKLPSAPKSWMLELKIGMECLLDFQYPSRHG